jgi:hypothetical protein
MKAYTDLEQSKKLAEILPLESADMSYRPYREEGGISDYQASLCPHRFASWIGFPCWSLTALLNYIKDKCGYYELVYISSTVNGNGNKLENVHRLSTDIYDVYEHEIIDVCYESILKMKELKLL